MRDWAALEISSRLNITMTCKQVRHESLLMFYASNTFLMRAKPWPSRTPLAELATWLKALQSEHRSMLGQVVICAKKSNETIVQAEWNREADRLSFQVSGRADVGGEKGHHCNDEHYLLVSETKEETSDCDETTRSPDAGND